MTVGIRIRHLQLRGAGRTYDVSFLNPDGSVRALNIIAGQISTGKTSALELIDYCLGAKDHPRHSRDTATSPLRADRSRVW